MGFRVSGLRLGRFTAVRLGTNIGRSAHTPRANVSLLVVMFCRPYWNDGISSYCVDHVRDCQASPLLDHYAGTGKLLFPTHFKRSNSLCHYGHHDCHFTARTRLLFYFLHTVCLIFATTIAWFVSYCRARD